MKRKKRNLKKKILKSCAALLLVFVMAVQGAAGASASQASLAESSKSLAAYSETDGTVQGVATSFVINKLFNTGLSAAGKVLSKVAESSNSEEFQEVSSFLNTWVFGNGTSNKLADISEMCEEILAEIQELNENMTAYSSEIERLLGEQNYKELYNDLKDSWNTCVELTGRNYSDSVDEALDAYMVYMEAAQVYAEARESGQSTSSAESDFDDAEEKFEEALIDVYKDKNPSSPIGESDEKKRYMLFTYDAVDSVILEFISIMSNEDNLKDYADAAAQYAYAAVPFSGDQYDIVINCIGSQYMRIVEMEMMYNEFLAMRAEYLDSEECSESIEKYMSEEDKLEYINDSGSVLNALWNGYETMMGEYNERNAEAANHMNDALDNELILEVSGAGNLTMKLGDYIQNCGDNVVTLTNTNFMSTFDNYEGETENFDMGPGDDDDLPILSNFSSNAKVTSEQMEFVKVAVPTGRGCKIYYILDPTQFETTDGEMSDKLYFYNLTSKIDISFGFDIHVPSCDFYNYTRGVYSGGGGTYTCVTGTNDIWTLFNSPALSYYSNQTSDYLRAYLPERLTTYANYLPSMATSVKDTYFLLPDYSTYRGMMGRGTAYTDFEGIKAKQQVAASTALETETLNSESRQSGESNSGNTYAVVLKATSDTYTSYVTTGCSDSSDYLGICVEGDANDTNEMTLAAGEEVSLRVKLAVGHALDSLTMEASDNSGFPSESTNTTVIADSSLLDTMESDQDGYYEFTLTVPYAAYVRLTLNTTAVSTAPADETAAASETEAVADEYEKPLNIAQETSQKPTVQSPNTGCEDLLWLWLALALCGGAAAFAEAAHRKCF